MNAKHVKRSKLPLDPAAAAGMIIRSRLITALKNASRKRSIFITAPGGYGKTVAARQWLSFVRGASVRLTMENADNDPGLFYEKLSLAFMKLTKREPAPAHTAFTLDSFLDTLSRLPARHARCYLLIDDLHMIRNEDILNRMPLIAKRIPEYARICILSRSQPTKGLMDTGQFELLTQDDLLFTADEVEWLGVEKELALTQPQVKDLLDLTGGWAIYLSVLLTSKQDLKSNHTIEQYFKTRVWDMWDDRAKTLLLQLAVPAKITPELCERLTGQPNSKAILDRFAMKDNAFLSAELDGVYRFHDLFRHDFLLKQTVLLSHDEVRRLNDVAAEWFYEQGMYGESARHFINNLDYDGINKCIYADQYYRSESAFLSADSGLRIIHQHCESLSKEAITKNLFLTTVCAMVEFHNGNGDVFLHYVDVLRQNFPKIAEMNREFIETTIFMIGLDYRVPLRECIQWLIDIGSDEPRDRNGKAIQALTITIYLPHFHRSARDKSEFFELNPEDLAKMDVTFGAMLGNEYNVIKPCLIAGIHYEKGKLLDAAHHALAGYHSCDDESHPESRFSASMILASILYAMGSRTIADEIMAETEYYIKHKARFLHPNFKALQTERSIRNGDTEAAKEWLESYSNADAHLAFYQICRHFTTLRSYIALKDYSTAILFGERLLELARQYNRPLDQIESGILLAIAYWHHNEPEAAVKRMHIALQTAMPYGFTQLFINEGNEILPLIWAMCAQSHMNTELSEFVSALTDRLYDIRKVKQGPDQPPRLSAMRKVMLNHLLQGHSYKQIAGETGIAHATVKRHVLDLYKQLGVHNAKEAILTAKMYELIE
jgi:LuxR family maltose regulon positive regulatory protein